MIEAKLDGVESLRVRAQGHLTIEGIESPPVMISCDSEPEVTRDGAAAEVFLRANAEVRVPPGVAVEVIECAGHLEVEDFAANLSVGHVAGNFSASKTGSIAIRGNADGRCYLEDVGAVAGRCVKGDLLVEKARSITFDLVAGDAACLEVGGEAAIEQIGGRCTLEEIGGGFRAHTVGGKLEAERLQFLTVDTVGGKLRAGAIAGDLTVKTIGGKASIDGAANVAIATVGGHLSVRGVSGNVSVSQVGGAARLDGDFSVGANWGVKSGGRMLVELPQGCSAAIEAVARHGRVKVYGAEGDIRYTGAGCMTATFGKGECKLALETGGSDIIIEGEDARGRANAGARLRWRDIGAPFQSMAQNIGEGVPGMVAEIVGAAGRIAAEATSFSGNVAREVTRGVADAMREVEREIGDLKREVPEQAAEKLSKLGDQIRDLVSEALEERRSRTRADAERIRERVHEEVQRMREAIRQARREREPAGGNRESASDTSRGERSQKASAEPAPTERLDPHVEMLRILEEVRTGKIDPAEADDLIRALMEVERADKAQA